MASLAVQLEDEVIEKLQHRASEEVHEILRDAVKREDEAPMGLGSRLAARFRDIGLKEDILELRGYPVVPADFDDQ